MWCCELLYAPCVVRAQPVNRHHHSGPNWGRERSASRVVVAAPSVREYTNYNTGGRIAGFQRARAVRWFSGSAVDRRFVTPTTSHGGRIVRPPANCGGLLVQWLDAHRVLRYTNYIVTNWLVLPASAIIRCLASLCGQMCTDATVLGGRDGGRPAACKAAAASWPSATAAQKCSVKVRAEPAGMPAARVIRLGTAAHQAGRLGTPLPAPRSASAPSEECAGGRRAGCASPRLWTPLANSMPSGSVRRSMCSRTRWDGAGLTHA